MTKTRPDIKIGTVLVGSGGYGQTNVEAYQVVGMTKSGKSVRIRRIAMEQVLDEYNPQAMADRCVPCPGVFYTDQYGNDPESEKVLTKRILDADNRWGPRIKMDYPGDLYPELGWSPCPECGGELEALEADDLPEPQLACADCGGMFAGEKRSFYRSWYY